MTETSDTMKQARASLATLGLDFRIEDEDAARIDADTWREITRLTHLAIECVTFTAPEANGHWLRIDTLHTTPNAGGYCTTRAADSVYWIPKADLPRLRELEDYLDLTIAHVRRAAFQAGETTTISLEDVMRKFELDE
jgi:hypothetical protein